MNLLFFRGIQVILTASDANFKFSYILLDVGAFMTESDASVRVRFLKKKTYFLIDKVGNFNLPFCFVADDAGSLGKRIIKHLAPIEELES